MIVALPAAPGGSRPGRAIDDKVSAVVQRGFLGHLRDLTALAGRFRAGALLIAA